MLSKDRIPLRRKSSKLYVSLVVFMVLGFGFFLSSRFIFEEKIQVNASPINEEIEISNNQNIRIYEWIYNKDINEMQLIIETNNLKKEYENINFEAFQRSDGNQVEIENVYTLDEVHVLKIKDIDPEYIQIAVDIIGVNPTDEKEGNINSESDYEENSSHNNENDEKEIIETVYTDYRKVENDSINLEGDKDYINYITSIIVSDTEKEIEKINTIIDSRNQEIENNKSRIEELTNEKVYQTEDEKLTTDSNINGLQTENKTISDEIGTLEYDIVELEDKIQKTQQRQREELLK